MRDVFANVAGVDQPAFGKYDVYLVGIEWDLIAARIRLAGMAVLIHQALDRLVGQDGFVNDLGGVRSLDANVKVVLRKDADNGAYFAKTGAAAERDCQILNSLLVEEVNADGDIPFVDDSLYGIINFLTAI